MKNLLLVMFALVAFSMGAFAQVAICETPCAVVTDQPFVETTIPYYTDQPLSYLVNADMDLCVSARCPETTNVRVEIYNNYGIDATVDVSSISISGLTNLPEGLEYCVSQSNVSAGDYFSIRFYGTPTEEGDFNINISGTIVGRITSPLTMNVPDRTLSFETGIILHISQNPNAVTANFVASATQITEGETITFTNLSQNANAYIWTFTGGNPITSTEESPSVTYSEAGIYTVSLRAAASTLQLLTNGVTETKENYIIVTAPTSSGISVDFEAAQTAVQVGETVHFTSNCSSNVEVYQWTFDGGTPSTSTNANPEVVYDTPGVYDVRLKAGTSNILINITGVTKTKSEYITVVADPIDTTAVEANFNIPASAIDVNESVTMQNISRNATAYFWSFEGASPSNSTEENPTITYLRPGRYSITLFATNGTNSDTKTVEVCVADVVSADFIASSTAISIGEHISFTNLSTNASSYYWSFEGATPSTSMDETPEVTYLNAGVYNVTLFATNGATSDMESKVNYIMVVDNANVMLNETEEVKVYPNPVGGLLNVYAEGMDKVEVVDMLGRVVVEQDVFSDNETIDVSGMPSATYMIRITTSAGVVVRNIVVE